MPQRVEIIKGWSIIDFERIIRCRRFNVFFLCQQLWDYIFIVRTCIEDWKTTPWRRVDVENMDIECKKFAKDIRLLDKEMRSWDTYVTLEATVKNMLTSLRAVGELQNPAIRERHWIQLMASTKVFIFLCKHSISFALFTIGRSKSSGTAAKHPRYRILLQFYAIVDFSFFVAFRVKKCSLLMRK